MAAATLAAAPALAQPERKTELVELGGKSVDRMQLRYDFNSAWVVDNQNILYRDNTRDYYLVTLKEACEPLDNRGRPFSFHPAWSWQLLASRDYEVRPQDGQWCDVARIEQVDDAKATELRDKSQWRVW
jgi:hypothetical protein